MIGMAEGGGLTDTVLWDSVELAFDSFLAVLTAVFLSGHLYAKVLLSPPQLRYLFCL